MKDYVVRVTESSAGLGMLPVGEYYKRSIPDMVTHPPHYQTGGIETIDFIEAKGLGYHEGQVVKYLTRAKYKGREMEDLRKAQWYLNRIIAKRGV